MAKKSLLSKKSLKSMFSKSDANLESADTRIFEETVDVEKKKTVSTIKDFKAFFSKSDTKLNESAEFEDRYGGGKTSKFKKKTKNDKSVKVGLHKNDISGAEAQSLGEARVQDIPPSVSRQDKKTSHFATAPRSKVEDLSVSELDHHKHRKFGTFTFGLLKRKKKRRGLSQSTTELHGPEVKGQEEDEEEEEPLDVDTRTFSITVNPLPLDNQSLPMDFLRDSPDMRTVDKMMRKAPIATMPEFDGEEPIDVQRDVSDDDTDTDTDCINMEAKGPFYLTPPNIPPSLTLTAVGATEKGVAFSVPPLNSPALVICDIPLKDAQPGPVHLVTEASSAAFPIGQPETAALFSTNDHSVPDTVTSLSAKVISVPETPPSISTNFISVPETLTSTSTNYSSVPETLPSISTMDVCVPKTLPSISTNYISVPDTLHPISTNYISVPETFPSISTNQSSVPETLPSISTNQSSVPETLPSISTNQSSVPETLTSTSTNDSSFCNSVPAYPTNTISDCVLDTTSYSASAYGAPYDSLFPGSSALAVSDPYPAKDISETSCVPALNTSPPSASVLPEPDRRRSSIITETDTPINLFTTETDKPVISFATKAGEPIQSAVTETESHTVPMCQHFDPEPGDTTHSTILPSVITSSVYNIEVPDCAAANIEGSFNVNELPAKPTGTNTEITVSDSGPCSIDGSLYVSLFPNGFSSTSDHGSSVNSTQAFDPSNFSTNASPSKMAASHTETGVPVYDTDTPHTNSEIPVSRPDPNTSNPDLDERLHTANSGLDQPAQLSNLAPTVLREDVLTFSPTTVCSENVPHENINPAGRQPDMTSTMGSVPQVLPESGVPSELAVPQVLPEALPLSSPGAVRTDHSSFPKAEEGVSSPPQERCTVSDTDDRPGTSMNLDVPCTGAETMAASSGPYTVETMAVRSGEDVVEMTVSRSAQDVVDIMAAGSGEAVVEIVVAGSDPNEVQMKTTENGKDVVETSPTCRQEAVVTTETGLGVAESKTSEEREEGRTGEESTARQMYCQADSDAERLMGSRERGTTEEWSQIEEAEQKAGGEVRLVPLVQHVLALKECEWAPPFLEKDEGRKGKLNMLTHTLTHTLPSAEACACTYTHPPGLSPVKEEVDKSAGAENVQQFICGNTQREDHPLPSHTHTTDHPLPSHTHTTDNKILVTINPEREDSDAHIVEGAGTSAKITEGGTHTHATHCITDKVDFSVPDPDSENTHTLHAVREAAPPHTLTHNSEALSETITHIEPIVLESDTHFVEREVMSGVSREGGGTFPGRSGRASPDSGVTAQVAAKLPVTETHKHAFPDTLVEREEREDRFPETNLSQLARSVNASADPSPAVEQPGLQTQLIRADLDSDAEMNSSYDIQSTLSSTFTLRPSPTSEGSPPNEFKHRIHKVSLVSEDASASAAPESVDLRGIRTDPEPGGAEVDLRGIRTDPEPGGAEVDLRGIRTDPEPGGAEVDLRGIRMDPEPGGAEVGPPAAGYKWKQFDVEIPSTPEPTGEESDFLSSTSSSLSLSQTGLYTRHLTYPSPLSPETPGLHGNMGRPSDSSKVQLSSVSKAGGGTGAEGGWRSRRDWAEPKAPAGEETGEGDREAVERGTQWNKSGWDSQRLPVSGVSPAAAHHGQDIYHKDFAFSGVFTATRVELTPDLSPSSPLTPVTPDPSSPYQQDMENMMDTLKSMDRPKRSCSLRGVPPSLFSSLPPIVEDAFSPNSTLGPATTLAHSPPAPGAPDKAHNGGPPSSLPVDLGIKWSSPKDKLSPLEMMKLQQKQESVGDKNPGFIPTRRSTLGSDSSHDSSPSYLNGGGGGVNPLTPGSTSRLDNSFLFSGYRQGSMEQPSMENDEAKAYLSRASSLPDIGPSNDRLSFSSIGIPKTGTGTVAGTGTDNTVPSRYERLSFLVSSSSLTGAPDSNSRISRPSTLQLLSSPTSTGERTFSSPSHLHSPTAPSDLQRNFSMEALTARFNHNQAQNLAQTQGMGAMNGMGGSVGSIGSMGLQRSFSTEGTSGGGGTLLFNNVHGGSHFNPEPEPEKIQMVPKYRAFPDAYLTKEKEHGKLNPRPGKMFIFDEAGMCGQRIEVRGDVIDATPWQLQETISIRVIRGGWVLYEKPNFKGEKIALDEGDIEITYPFGPPEEGMEDGQQQQQQSGQTAQREQNGTREQNGEKENGEKENGGQEGEEGNTIPVRRFIIGSIRRAVRDYSVPEISLFPEENAEGKKVTFRDTCEDARIFGFPIKANSIIINAGLWLVYAEPFFQGIPKVLEVGGFHNPAAWGVEQPYVGSVHPLKIGEPRVEKPNEAKLVIYEKPYFTGKTRTIYSNMKDFMTRVERSQIAFMYSAGSIKVQGGCWVGHEKEGFRGYQYLLEEGEYHDWRVWGGHNAELRSIRVLRADLTEPMLVMFEQPEGEAEEGQQEEENSFEVTEAIPDVELFGYRPTTRSINILSGAWVAYSHVDYSGEQYILEKGFYNNCADWGSQDNRICSIQPILLAAGESHGSRNEVVLYSETDFQGECHMYDEAQETLADRLLAKSCRVMGGSWVMYDAKSYKGDLYVLSEGDYPNFSSMGCPSSYVIRSLKPVPQMLSLPSISLFGLECLEGREITIDTDMVNMLEEGYNNHTLSLRVNSGSWVVCEHSNYRGRQFLLETIEIPNWPKFSQLHTIGSMYPVRQRRRFFRIKNKERGHFLSIQGGVEELKSGRVVVMETVEGMSEIWFYQDGLIKNKLAPSMSLQVMGNVEAGAKVVLWSETRQPVQTWSAQMSGAVVSLTFPGMVLDIKGGKTYDKNFAVIMPKSEERPCQQWELEIL